MPSIASLGKNEDMEIGNVGQERSYSKQSFRDYYLFINILNNVNF